MKNLDYRPRGKIYLGFIFTILAVSIPLVNHFTEGFNLDLNWGYVSIWSIILLGGLFLFISGLKETKIWKKFSLEFFLAWFIIIIIPVIFVGTLIYGIFFYKI